MNAKAEAVSSAWQRLIQRHHDAFAVELLGPLASGVPAGRLEELLATGVVDPSKLGGLQVPGMRHPCDPFLFVQLVAKIVERAPGSMRARMRTWGLARWKGLIDKELDARWQAAKAVELPLSGGVRFALESAPAPAAAATLGEPALPPAPTTATVAAEYKVGEPPPWLAPAEKQSYRQALHRGGEFCRGLGNRHAEQVEKDVAEAWQGEDIVQEVIPEKRQERLDVIRELTAGAVETGYDAEKLARDLADATEDWSHNWRRIARTELQGAYNEGVLLDGWDAWGPETRIARFPNTTACDACRALFLDARGLPRIFTAVDLVANGTNVGKKARDWKATVWPAHPHCLLKGQRILTKRGEIPVECVLPGDVVWTSKARWRKVTHARRSWYIGQVVKLQGDGWDVEATAEHLFLTSGGWRQAASLDVGGDVLREGGDVFRRRPLQHLHAQEQPASTVQERRLLRVLTGLSRAGVPVAAVDLDGDLYVREGEIKVENVHRMRNDGHLSDFAQRVVDLLFVEGLQFSGTGLRAGDTLFVRYGATSASLVCRGDLSPSFAGSRLRVPNLAGVAQAALHTSGLPNTFDDRSAVDAETLCDLLDRELLVEVEPQDQVDVEGDESAHGESLIAATKIVNVKRSKYEGLVFNLTVAEDESCFAEGVASHNCACDTLVVPPGMIVSSNGRLRREET